MPLSAIVGTAKVMDASGPGSLGGTYSGNPLSCAAALAVLDTIEEENILARSTQMGRLLAERFAVWQQRFEMVSHPRNLGAMAAFELLDAHGKPDAAMAQALCAKAREQGLILLSCGFYSNTIRVLVPITAPSDVLKEGLSIIERSLEMLVSQ
ncbi:4-aminobutyrate aminotransferase [Halomonas sp. R57-5]|nr:4-aminobutyrate aminotransferase [Halomonas sp. R57-5]